MTDDSDRYTKKTDPGRYKRTCENPDCPHGYEFKTANPRAKYCSEECQKSAQNARNYLRRKSREKAHPLTERQVAAICRDLRSNARWSGTQEGEVRN